MKKETALLLVIIILKFILHYALVNPVYELHRDEYLHLDQARHLAWGYYSVPPLTSWIAWLISARERLSGETTKVLSGALAYSFAIAAMRSW